MAKSIGVQMLEFSQNGDERGYLVVVEGQQDIPYRTNEWNSVIAESEEVL